MGSSVTLQTNYKEVKKKGGGPTNKEASETH